MEASPDPILIKIEEFLKRTGMKPWLFGRKAAEDPKLVDQLRAGREPRRDTRAKIEAFIAEQSTVKPKRVRAS